MSTRRDLLAGGAGMLLGGMGAREAGAGDQFLRTRTEIIAVSKFGNGQEQVTGSRIFACPDGHLTREIKFLINSEWLPYQCDEDCSLQFLNGVFSASITVQRRETPQTAQRGCFTGKWRLAVAGVAVASGTMVGTVVAGTHNLIDELDCEPCDPRLHFEGTLEGRVKHPECKGSLCCSIQGRGLDPELPSFQMRTEGALIRPCHPPQ